MISVVAGRALTKHYQMGAPIGIAVVGPDGRFLCVNHALCEIVGDSQAERTQLIGAAAR